MASLTPAMVAEARAGLRAADNCELNQGSARLCGACAATLVYLARLVVAAADATATTDTAPTRTTCARGSNSEQGLLGHWCTTHAAVFLLSRPTCDAVDYVDPGAGY